MGARAEVTWFPGKEPGELVRSRGGTVQCWPSHQWGWLGDDLTSLAAWPDHEVDVQEWAVALQPGNREG